MAASARGPRPPRASRTTRGSRSRPTTAALTRVLAAARSLVGRRRVEVGGRRFRADCSGFVRGVYSAAGVDLFAVPMRRDENGVRLIHRWFALHGRNYRSGAPSPGDVVYFNDTYDRNGDRRLDDWLTHVGIVDRVLADGTVYVIHYVSAGIEREPMNLAHPHAWRDRSGRVINAFLRRRTRHDRAGTPRLMGELFAGYGTIRARPEPQAAR